MAKARYDPAEAVTFWQTFAREESLGPQKPAFFSTHPSDETRIARFQELLPEAESFARPARPARVDGRAFVEWVATTVEPTTSMK